MGFYLLLFGISEFEFIIILAVLVVVLGPKKLPEIARTIGRAVNEMRRATTDIKREINSEIRKVDIEKDITNPKPAKEKKPPKEDK